MRRNRTLGHVKSAAGSRAGQIRDDAYLALELAHALHFLLERRDDADPTARLLRDESLFTRVPPRRPPRTHHQAHAFRRKRAERERAAADRRGRSAARRAEAERMERARRQRKRDPPPPRADVEAPPPDEGENPFLIDLDDPPEDPLDALGRR